MQESCRAQFEKERQIPAVLSFNSITRRPAVEKRKEAFLNEWNATLQILRDIGIRVSEDILRPEWIPFSTPFGLQADLFLHAYYFQKIREGKENSISEFHDANSSDPEMALQEAFNWWKSGAYETKLEITMMSERSPELRQLLSKEGLKSMTEISLISVVSMVFAMREYARQYSYSGVDVASPLGKERLDQRFDRFGKHLWKQRSSIGKRASDTLDFVLYGGSDDSLSLRLWTACVDPEWKIPGLGKGAIGEIVGWAKPTNFPPRNNRTSKALYALGYDVKMVADMS